MGASSRGKYHHVDSDTEHSDTTPKFPKVTKLYRTRPRFIPLVLTFLAIFLFTFHGMLSAFASQPSHHHRKHPHGRPGMTVEERVDKIMSETPLIDGHNDLAILIRYLYNNRIYSPTFTTSFESGGMSGHVDLPRLHAGKSGGAFWSVYAPCPENGTDYSTKNYASSVQFTHNQIDLLHRLTSLHPSVFSPPTLPPSSALSSFLSPPHPLISPLGIEGLHQVGNSYSNLRHFHALGVRYATLTHNCGNRYADAALENRGIGRGLRKARPVHDGVSAEGMKMVGEMNRLGMGVDLSHTSHLTQMDVLGGGGKDWQGSMAPVMYSHSSVWALCPHPRNVKDEALRLVGEKKGVVMVNFNPEFISCVAAHDEDGLLEFYPGNSTLGRVVDHIMYIGELIGYEYVGIGSDFDGIEDTPKGLEDVSKFPDLVAEMLRRGVSDEDAGRVTGGNVLRVWGAIEDVARELQGKGVLPLEDELEGLLGEMDMYDEK